MAVKVPSVIICVVTICGLIDSVSQESGASIIMVKLITLCYLPEDHCLKEFFEIKCFQIMKLWNV
jgi:hypothetical protein